MEKKSRSMSKESRGRRRKKVEVEVEVLRPTLHRNEQSTFDLSAPFFPPPDRNLKLAALSVHVPYRTLAFLDRLNVDSR